MGVYVEGCTKDVYSNDKEDYAIVMSKSSQASLMGMSVKRRRKKKISHH